VEADGLGALMPRFWATLVQADVEIVGGWRSIYHERCRPQFHFSARRGWHNDPNGLVTLWRPLPPLFPAQSLRLASGGQHHWGHAVSHDLLHWQELGEALYPDHLRGSFFRTAVVDWENRSGLGRRRRPAR
jgi:sucrose-6-phosphate hydrolase SacC (GH32 family)